MSNIREAASLVILRDGTQGVEVLMMRRPEKGGDFRSGAWVFPGGVVDAEDAQAQAHCHGLTDAQASQRLGLPEGGLQHFVAAARECFEEVGLLLARTAEGEPVHLAGHAAQLRDWRHRLHQRHGSLNELLRAQGWQLDLSAVAFWAHWLTPPTRPKRFDTRFFVVQAPAGQVAEADDTESLELRWLRPADAAHPESGLHMLRVTRLLLEQMSGFESAAQGYQTARALQGVKRAEPSSHEGVAPVWQPKD
jgi:8-oxo-dGTP pyrophosphatase MutT (NUDIX family)